MYFILFYADQIVLMSFIFQTHLPLLLTPIWLRGSVSQTCFPRSIRASNDAAPNIPVQLLHFTLCPPPPSVSRSRKVTLIVRVVAHSTRAAFFRSYFHRADVLNEDRCLLGIVCLFSHTAVAFSCLGEYTPLSGGKPHFKLRWPSHRSLCDAVHGVACIMII